MVIHSTSNGGRGDDNGREPEADARQARYHLRIALDSDQPEASFNDAIQGLKRCLGKLPVPMLEEELREILRALADLQLDAHSARIRATLSEVIGLYCVDTKVEQTVLSSAEEGSRDFPVDWCGLAVGLLQVAKKERRFFALLPAVLAEGHRDANDDSLLSMHRWLYLTINSYRDLATHLRVHESLQDAIEKRLNRSDTHMSLTPLMDENLEIIRGTRALDLLYSRLFFPAPRSLEEERLPSHREVQLSDVHEYFNQHRVTPVEVIKSAFQQSDLVFLTEFLSSPQAYEVQARELLQIAEDAPFTHIATPALPLGVTWRQFKTSGQELLASQNGAPFSEAIDREEDYQLARAYLERLTPALEIVGIDGRASLYGQLEGELLIDARARVICDLINAGHRVLVLLGERCELLSQSTGGRSLFAAVQEQSEGVRPARICVDSTELYFLERTVLSRYFDQYPQARSFGVPADAWPLSELVPAMTDDSFGKLAEFAIFRSKDDPGPDRKARKLRAPSDVKPISV